MSRWPSEEKRGVKNERGGVRACKDAQILHVFPVPWNDGWLFVCSAPETRGVIVREASRRSKAERGSRMELQAQAPPYNAAGPPSRIPCPVPSPVPPPPLPPPPAYRGRLDRFALTEIDSEIPTRRTTHAEFMKSASAIFHVLLTACSVTDGCLSKSAIRFRTYCSRTTRPTKQNNVTAVFDGEGEAK